MPTNYTSRVLLILVVLWVALWFIFPAVPGSSLFSRSEAIDHRQTKPQARHRHGRRNESGLRDQAAGRRPTAAQNLAEQVMESLKKRVDPDGVRNLIWRPQGNTRLEIQMPLTGNTDKAKEIRKTFDDSRPQAERNQCPRHSGHRRR